MVARFMSSVKSEMNTLNGPLSPELLSRKLRLLTAAHFTSFYLPKFKALNRMPKSGFLTMIEAYARKTTNGLLENSTDVSSLLQQSNMPVSLDPTLIELWTGDKELAKKFRTLQEFEAKFITEFRTLLETELTIYEPKTEDMSLSYKTRKAFLSTQRTNHLYIPVNLSNLSTLLRATRTPEGRRNLLDRALVALAEHSGPAEIALLETVKARIEFAKAMGFTCWRDLVSSTPSLNSAAGKKQQMSALEQLLQRQKNLQNSTKAPKVGRRNTNQVVGVQSNRAATSVEGVVRDYVLEEALLAAKKDAGFGQNQSSEELHFGAFRPVDALDEASMFLSSADLVPRLVPEAMKVLGLTADRQRAGPARGWMYTFDAFKISMNQSNQDETGGSGAQADFGFLYVRLFQEKRPPTRKLAAVNSFLDISGDGFSEYDGLDSPQVKCVAPGHVMVDIRLPPMKTFTNMDVTPELLQQILLQIGDGVRLLLANPESSAPLAFPRAAGPYVPLESTAAWLLADAMHREDLVQKIGVAPASFTAQAASSFKDKEEMWRLLHPAMGELQQQLVDTLIDDLLHSIEDQNDFKKVTASPRALNHAAVHVAQEVFPFPLNHRHSIFSLAALDSFSPLLAGKQTARLLGRVAAHFESHKPDVVRVHNIALTAPAPFLEPSAMQALDATASRPVAEAGVKSDAIRQRLKNATQSQNPNLMNDAFETFTMTPLALANRDSAKAFVKTFSSTSQRLTNKQALMVEEGKKK